MSKYKIKEGNGEAVVSYRQKDKSGKLKMNMVKVLLKNATNTQMAELFSLEHPFIEEVKSK